MDTKSKILLWLFGALILLSVSASFYRYIFLNDFIVEVEVECDPSAESCFVLRCDPSAESELVCTGDPEIDTQYLKIVHRNAKNIPQCEDGDDECKQFECPTNSEDECSEILCDVNTLTEYGFDEECSNPADFIEIEEENIVKETTEADSEQTSEVPLEDTSSETTDDTEAQILNTVDEVIQ